MLWTKINFEKEQRVITKQLCRVELSFLFTALLLNEVYPPVKFKVDNSNTF
jgi:hypothetical protein